MDIYPKCFCFRFNVNVTKDIFNGLIMYERLGPSNILVELVQNILHHYFSILYLLGLHKGKYISKIQQKWMCPSGYLPLKPTKPSNPNHCSQTLHYASLWHFLPISFQITPLYTMQYSSIQNTENFTIIYEIYSTLPYFRWGQIRNVHVVALLI